MNGEVMEQSLIKVDNFILPESDDRKYRALELKNGLKAFLVSDKETKLSGCCLSVYIGAMYSPKELNGLAHFLEHMLFCGTKKYPDANEYRSFIANHGGKKQGVTTRSTTTYYFEIKNEAFKEALDRFSSFFTEPLFCKEMTDKEISAIENEFNLKYHSDERVRFHMLAQLAEKSHPLNCFTTGNKETLKIKPKELGIDLHKELLNFYNTYYSSNIMSILIYGKEELDILENYAVEYFSEIANHEVECYNYKQLFIQSPPYTEKIILKKIIKIIPYETDKRLKVFFPLPPLDDYNDSCAPAYISHIIGHKGKGGISSILRDRKLSTSASFTINNEDPSAMAQFSVVLTDLGYSNINLVLEVIFNFLALFKSGPIVTELIEEFIGVSKASFTYQPKLSIHDLFSLPAKYLKFKCKFEEILSSGWVVKQFSEDDVFSILEYMNKNNCFILISSQEFEKEFKENQNSYMVEYYYGTKYSITEFSDDLNSIIDFSSAENASRLGLALPKPNPFVSSDFSIVNPQIECSNDYARTPELLTFGDIPHRDISPLKIWFKPDTTFNSPHSLINIRLVAEKIHEFYNYSFEKLGSSNELVFQVFGEILNQVMHRCMHELSSDILAASLSYTINFNARTNVFVLEGVGISQKLDYLVSIMFDYLFNKTEIEKYYDEAILIIKKDWKNKLIKPNLVSFSLECISEALSPNFFNRKEKLDVLENFTFRKYCSIRRHFLGNCRLEGLIMGNFSISSAREISIRYWESLNTFQNSLGQEDKSGGSKIELFSILDLKKDIYTLNVIPNNSDKNGCWLFSFFLGKFSLKKQVLCDILLPFITSEIFSELRTNQQLAYSVRATQIFSSPAIVIGYYLQSSEYTNALTLKRLLSFHNDHVRTSLKKKLDPEFFIKLKDSTIQTLSSSPKSIFEEYKTYIHEINEKTYLFDIRQKKIELIKGLSYQEFIDLYDSLWVSKSILTEIRSQIDSSKSSDEIGDYITPSIPENYVILDENSGISREKGVERIFLGDEWNI
ncbi:insulinase-like peptidase [Cryptosporidium felis]|nr:insulinase-like peptidase [Cryptosporidium felis]